MNGLLLIDKAQGMTSHDVVARVRRIIGQRDIGHAGTLDPFATGLLILCIGHATRLSEYLIGENKIYTGRMKLGERTNTDDLDGEVIERRAIHVSPAELQHAGAACRGDIMQVPPQYSAIQIGGRRAYKMARGGETVDLPARPVRIESLELDFAPGLQPEYVDLRVNCSAGTYIRALARDIGEMLGCGGHLISLRRVQSGPFQLGEAITLELLQEAAERKEWQRLLVPMDRAVVDFPPITLDSADSQRLVMGQFVRVTRPVGESALWRVYDAEGQFIALGTLDRSSTDGPLLKPLKVFHSRPQAL